MHKTSQAASEGFVEQLAAKAAKEAELERQLEAAREEVEMVIAAGASVRDALKASETEGKDAVLVVREELASATKAKAEAEAAVLAAEAELSEARAESAELHRPLTRCAMLHFISLLSTSRPSKCFVQIISRP